MNKSIEINYKLALLIVFSLTIIVYFSLTIQGSYHNWNQIQKLDEKNSYLETQNIDLQLQLRLLENKLLHYTGQMQQLMLLEAYSLEQRLDFIQKNLCDIENFIQDYGVYVK